MSSDLTWEGFVCGYANSENDKITKFAFAAVSTWTYDRCNDSQTHVTFSIMFLAALTFGIPVSRFRRSNPKFLPAVRSEKITLQQDPRWIIPFNNEQRVDCKIAALLWTQCANDTSIYVLHNGTPCIRACVDWYYIDRVEQFTSQGCVTFRLHLVWNRYLQDHYNAGPFVLRQWWPLHLFQIAQFLIVMQKRLGLKSPEILSPRFRIQLFQNSERETVNPSCVL